MVSFSEYHGVYWSQDGEWDNTLTVIVKDVSIFKIRCWYNKGHDDKINLEHIAIRCGNCGKETGLSMDNMNTKYKDIFT